MNMLMLVAKIVLLSATAAQPRLAQNHQVLQRDQHDEAACVVELPAPVQSGDRVHLTVESEVTADTQARLLRDEQLEVSAQADAVLLEELAVGGPYHIQLVQSNAAGQLRGQRSFEHVLVGDLWVLAGQSNMEGVPPVEVPSREYAAVKMLNLDNQWLPAAEPVHRKYEALAPAFVNLMKNSMTDQQIAEQRKTSREAKPLGGVGPGLAFAQRLYDESQVPIGLLPCAYGGSSMAQWDPAGLSAGDASLYGFMIARVRLAGGHLRGVLWFQGESDAGNPDQVLHPFYQQQFEHFLEALRRDLHDPHVPIIMAQIGRFIGYDGRYAKKGTLDRSYEIVREAQRQVAARTDHVSLVSTIDLPHYDIIHLSRTAQERLGRRLAFVALPYVRPDVAPRKGPDVAQVRFVDAQKQSVEVKFCNVHGHLRAAGEPHGFELRDVRTGAEHDWVYAVELNPDQPDRALLKFDVPLSSTLQLIYAPRANTYANLVDDEDLAMPAFGPLAIEESR